MATRHQAGGLPSPDFTAVRRRVSLFLGAALLSAVVLLPARSAHAVKFPDTAELKKEYRVIARKDGRPTGFHRTVRGDSANLRLEWSGTNLISARLEQGDEFDPDSFSVLTSEYGNGAAWHESMGTSDSGASRKLYPGLQQEWILKGYGGEKGWLGSGVNRGRYFLVFRETSPVALRPVAGALRLNPGIFAMLDTSSQWLRVTCREKGASASKAAVCFSPSEDPRLRIRIDRRKPLSMQAWLEESESGALADIKKAMESVPDAAQAEYAGDLSQMLLGEARMFLVKLSQRLPGLFNWPSWQIQDFKGGRIPPEAILPLVRRQKGPGDSLAALRYRDAGIRLDVDLYYRGTFHLMAEETDSRKGPAK